MAAIIAQLTRAKRERDKKKTFDSNKCMYHLEPFDAHFEPTKHNRYIVRSISFPFIDYDNDLYSYANMLFEGKKSLFILCPLIHMNIVSFLSCWPDFFCHFKSYKIYLTLKIPGGLML